MNELRKEVFPSSLWSKEGYIYIVHSAHQLQYLDGTPYPGAGGGPSI